MSMGTVLLGVTWGLVGLDVGWRALPAGGVEYIIQIAPYELEVFKQDKSIEGDIPSQLRDIRSYRIVVGTDILPREDPPKAASTAAPSLAVPPWPGTTTSVAGDRKKSGRSFFSPIASLWDRYPFAQSDSDPTKRIGQQEPSETKKTANIPSDRKSEQKPAPSVQADSKEPPKPSSSWITMGIVLCGSLGGNLYLVWITWETRARYHALVRRRKKAERHSRDRVLDPDADYEGEDE